MKEYQYGVLVEQYQQEKTKVLGERVDPFSIVQRSSHIDFWNNGSDKETKGFVTREIFCSSVGGLINT
jgi:hypothetical protein